MTKPSKDTIAQIVDEILTEMPLEERVSIANMNEEDADALQGLFDLYIRSKADPDDDEYENIMHELWERLKKTHRLRVVK
jgi:ATP-dependent exoDNAse (exonuclease V) beta subunit